MFDNFYERFANAFIAGDGYMMMLSGLGSTLILAVASLVIGIVLGTLVAIVKVAPLKGKPGKVLNAIANAYITVIRGTPVMVQLLLAYFAIFSNVGMPAIIVAIIVFGVNSSAYVAEIIRSGILAVDIGQTEAGRSLGLSYGQTMKKIILPQGIKNILPALGNELIVLIKETSVAGFITVFDLTRAARAIVARTYDAFVPYLVLAGVYLVIVSIATYFVHMVERRLRQSDKR